MTNSQKDVYDRVVAGFYRNADPTLAADALLFALDMDLFHKDQTLLLMFARMAQVYPEVDAQFRKLLTPSLDAQKQRIVQILVNPPDELKDARYMLTAISGPQDLDICWGEFLVTGSVEVVKRIVAVLDWKDLTRSLIDEALLMPKSGNIRLSESQSQSFRELGIIIGTTDTVHQPHITMLGDVDLLIWHGLQNKHEASTALVQQMRQDHLLHVATKGAALWSLRSNAEQHPSVKALCEIEAGIAGGAGRRYLQANNGVST